MPELQSLNTSQLIDLLAQYTASLSKTLTSRTIDEQYANSKLAIKAIQAEIELRKKSGTLSTDSATDATVPPDFS